MKPIHQNLPQHNAFIPGGARNIIPHSRSSPVPLRLRKLPMAQGGSVERDTGDYWGCYSPTAGGMWVAYDRVANPSVKVYARAKTRKDAAEQVRLAIPDVIFRIRV